MRDSHSLDPEHRALYGASLQPPAGYVFDAAVATTFSLDFETALAVPVSLALFAAENRDEILGNPLALLEAAERIAGRLLVFSDAGRIKAQAAPHSRLCSLLEQIIVEVAAPQGGAFHPKMWALRFAPVRAGDPLRLRLLVLSRNLTRDRSWDLALSLDGKVTGRAQAINRPLADFLRQLPSLATTPAPGEAGGLVDALAEDLRRTHWDLPEGFDSVAFAVNGLGGKPWCPGPCSRLGVISPFCDDKTLSKLASLDGHGEPQLIGRSDELALIPEATLDSFARVAVLDEMAGSEDGEDSDAGALEGLHAKAFVAEQGWNTAITIGSGNATRPALLSGSNVEIFATLTGKRSKVGSVEQIFGQEGFGRLTRPFVRGEASGLDPAQRAAEARLDAARSGLCRAGLVLRCARAAEDDGSSLWQVSLVPPGPLSLDDVRLLRLWPITRGEGHAREALAALRQGTAVDLGTMPLVDLTRFLACQLGDRESDACLLFSTGFPFEGLPAERNAAILRRMIDSKDAFLRYLRLLLSELGDPFATALAAQAGGTHGAWRVAGDDAPILEEMVRAFCQGGNQLRAIDRLITRLDAAGTGQPDPVPAEFRALWDTFRTALASKGAGHDS